MNEDIENISVKIAEVEPFCIAIEEVEKVMPPPKTSTCEQEIPDLLTIYNVAKI